MKRSLRRVSLVLVTAVVLAGCSNPADRADRLDGDVPTPLTQTTEATETPAPSATTYDPDVTSEEVPVAPDLTVSISQVRQTDGEVTASATASADGTCVFQFEPSDGSRPVVREATVRGGTCSVTIPVVEFAFLGQWTLRMTLYHDRSKAEDNADVAIH